MTDAATPSGMAEDLDSEIIRVYKEGLSMARTAARLGITAGKVRGVLKRASAARPHRLARAEIDAIVHACTHEGLTRAQAAGKFGRTPRGIGLALSRGGAVPAAGTRYLRAGAAASLAGISQETLRTLAYAGTVRYVRGTPHGKLLYFRPDIEAIAARCASEPTCSSSK